MTSSGTPQSSVTCGAVLRKVSIKRGISWPSILYPTNIESIIQNLPLQLHQTLFPDDSHHLLKMSTPVSIAGVESGDRNILFFTKANGRLASLTAQKYGPEDLESPEYARGEVQSAGNPVSAAIPHIGAAAFTADGKKQVSQNNFSF